MQQDGRSVYGRRRLPLGFGTSVVEVGAGALATIIQGARRSGTLNLSNKQLDEVPRAVFELSAGEKWWEVNELTKLDLSHNELPHLPQQLTTLGALSTLLLSHNKLRHLPTMGLACLRALDVSHNPLAALPDDIAHLTALGSLQCNSCGLEQLPGALGGPQQPKLSVVSACGNRLSALPPGLAAATAMVVLKAASNRLDELPGALVKDWGALRELDVSGNQLQELPGELGSLPHLAELDAHGNQLTALPAALGDAAELATLRLGLNQISSLPATLGLLPALQSLELSNNRLQELPEPLCGLRLVLLDLANNSLRRLPPALGAMTSLRSLPLHGNPLKIRRELLAGPVSGLLQYLRDQLEGPMRSSTAAQRAPSAELPALPPGALSPTSVARLLGGGGEVSLAGLGISSVPPEVWEGAASLAKLSLADNNLAADATLARGLGGLVRARALCLNNCNLNAWPLQACAPGCLGALQTLSLTDNCFAGPVPQAGLAACPALRSLDLSRVRDLSLPADFFAATPQLETLAVARTGLKELPAAVLKCVSLRQLLLPNNNLCSIPADTTRLTRLQELDLQNNALTNLPPQLGLMTPQLQVLLLEGNAIRVIRRAVLERGTPAVLQWLRDRIPAA